jgi:hypothetical protein
MGRLGAEGAILTAKAGLGVDDGAGEDGVSLEFPPDAVRTHDEVKGMLRGNGEEFACLFIREKVASLFNDLFCCVKESLIDHNAIIRQLFITRSERMGRSNK